MFVYNLKVNKSGIFKTVLFVLGIIALALMAVVGFNIFNNSISDKNLIDDSIPASEVATIEPEEYADILKCVHNDIDTYVGQKICCTGYVYRVSDLNENQLVLARDMDVGNNQTVIVGFLCSLNTAKSYENYSWVTITGEITKGTYNNQDMPIINVTSIEKTQAPESPTIPMPDDNFVPTAIIY